MRYIMYGKNIEVTEGLKVAVEDKLSKLSRYFTDDTEVHVTFSIEGDAQKIEVTIPTGADFNFCFRDSEGNWDNNWGNDYIYCPKVGEDYPEIAVIPCSDVE